jgi:hypothetical protein
MHYLINVIVKGENVTEALQNAKYGAEEMTGPGGDFDWYDMNGRWGASEAHDVTSKKGKESLKRGMELTRNEFDRALKTIQYMWENYSDDQIFNEEFTGTKEIPDGMYLSRYQFAVVAGDANSCYIYAPDGEVWGGRVENNKSLNHVLQSAKQEGTKLWVVPIDFHN